MSQHSHLPALGRLTLACLVRTLAPQVSWVMPTEALAIPCVRAAAGEDAYNESGKGAFLSSLRRDIISESRQFKSTGVDRPSPNLYHLPL